MVIKALTQVHVGVGRVGGVVDLPVQRDEFGFPCIYSSSLKGTFRSSLKGGEDCYGSEVGTTSPKESKLAFLDAHLVAMPVRSLHGVYAYVSCPLLMKRLAQKARLLGFEDLEKELSSLTSVERGKALVIGDGSMVFDGGKATLVEEFEFEGIKPEGTFENLRNLLMLDDRPLLIINDDDAKKIVNRSMVILTRIALEGGKKKVESKKLWSEEYVPQYTRFVSAVFAKDGDCYQKEIVEKIVGKGRKYMFVGGKETVGKGIIEVWVKGAE